MGKHNTGRFRDRQPSSSFDVLSHTFGLSVLASGPHARPAASMVDVVAQHDSLLKLCVLALHNRAHSPLPAPTVALEAVADRVEQEIATCGYWPCTDFRRVKADADAVAARERGAA